MYVGIQEISPNQESSYTSKPTRPSKKRSTDELPLLPHRYQWIPSMWSLEVKLSFLLSRTWRRGYMVKWGGEADVAGVIEGVS